MKKIFIHAKSLDKIELKNADRLPSRVGLASSIQFLDQLEDVKSQLEKTGKEVKICGQVLGCDQTVCENVDVDAFLYVGDGRFHPIGIAEKTGKPVYILVDGVVSEFDKSVKEEYDKKKKVALTKYLSAENVGVLVSTKHGQSEMDKAIEFKKAQKDKKVYLFMFNDLDFSQLENFPFVEVWVNTACPRLMDDYDKFNKPVINFEDLP